MKKRLSGIWRLTRFEEYVCFVIVCTLLGAAASRGSFGWLLGGVLVANWLAVAFAFMINDVEDALDDALDPAKAHRNPVSAGDLSLRTSRLSAFLVAGLAAILYATLGLGPFIAGVSCLILAYLYSWRPVRLKAIPVADLISHAAMLAGLQFLTAYLAFDGGSAPQWIFPLGLVVAISLYGQLYNEVRDFAGDIKAGVTHTASFIGQHAAHWLMLACLAIGIVSAIITLFAVRLIPIWVLILTVALASILAWLRLRRTGTGISMIEFHQVYQKPFEIGAAISLSAWFAGPPLLALLGFAGVLPHAW